MATGAAGAGPRAVPGVGLGPGPGLGAAAGLPSSGTSPRAERTGAGTPPRPAPSIPGAAAARRRAARTGARSMAGCDCL